METSSTMRWAIVSEICFLTFLKKKLRLQFVMSAKKQEIEPRFLGLLNKVNFNFFFILWIDFIDIIHWITCFLKLKYSKAGCNKKDNTLLYDPLDYID